MINISHKELSILKQCKLLQISRSSYYYTPQSESDYNLTLMKIIDSEYLQYPFFGSRQMMRHLKRMGHLVSRHKIRRLMRKMGLMAIYQKPRTTISNAQHKIYPYLLRNRQIYRPNQVWCSDITYIPMQKGFVYLVAVKDWYSRKVLSWRLSNTMDADFCIDALQNAITQYGRPEIFNTDQGSQFTGYNFVSVLEDNKIQISMDGKGRWLDNVFIERLWRSLKYECIFLQEFSRIIDLKKAISEWFEFYNFRRPHSVFDGNTPHEVYTRIVNHLTVANTA